MSVPVIKHVLSINDFDRETLFDFILPGARSRIATVRDRQALGYDPTTKAMLAFFEPSTRTRGSNEEAIRLLGWTHDQMLGMEANSLIKRETMAETVRMMAAYNTDIIVMRTRIEGTQRFIAELLEDEGWNVAVHNAGDGSNQHPTQTVLDLLTIDQEFRRFDDLVIGFFGDLKYGRTVHSLLIALAKRKNIKVILVATQATALQEQYRKLFSDVVVTDDMNALIECDIIYGARIQEERFSYHPLELEELRRKFTLTPALMNQFRHDAIIMHPMPYVQEFPPSVRRDQRVVITKQAGYGVPARLFLLEQSYQNRHTRILGGNDDESELEMFVETPYEEYRRSRRKPKDDYKHFRPIISGTVIDHIPCGFGPVLMTLIRNQLGIEGRCAKHTIEEVDSRRMGQKDVLLFDGGFLSPGAKEKLFAVVPSLTINETRDEMFRKFRPKTKPVLISGIGHCPNQQCITHHDPEAAVRIKFHRTDGGLICHFCEKEFSEEEVIRA